MYSIRADVPRELYLESCKTVRRRTLENYILEWPFLELHPRDMGSPFFATGML
jgi:hypothetical protein